LQSVCARVFSRLFNRGNNLLCHYLTRFVNIFDIKMYCFSD
ncbi:unnamed protein product, partial [Prunus brigantina]